MRLLHTDVRDRRRVPLEPLPRFSSKLAEGLDRQRDPRALEACSDVHLAADYVEAPMLSRTNWTSDYIAKMHPDDKATVPMAVLHELIRGRLQRKKRRHA